MIEEDFLKQIAKDHKKNLLDRDQGKLFLKELMAPPKRVYVSGSAYI